MRKMLYLCGACLVAAAGMTFLVAWYTECHPNSFVGRCVIAAYQANDKYNPVFRASEMAAEKAHAALTKSKSSTAHADHKAESAVQETSAAPTIVPPLEAPVVNGIDADAKDDSEFRLPGNIQVEVPVPPARAAGGVEESEEPALSMPPAVDDSSKQMTMPYADDVTPEPGCEESDIQDHFGSPNCQEEHDHDVQYPGCPSMVCPAHTTCPEASTPETGKPSKRLFEMLQPRSDKDVPMHPEVDTTEARPSDLKPLNFGPSPY